MLLRFTAALFALFFLCLLGAGFWLSKNSGRLLEEAARGEGFALKIGESSLSYLPLVFTARKVAFRQGDEKSTALVGEAAEITAPLSLSSLLKGSVGLGQVLVKEPKVEVIEGDLNTPDSPSKPVAFTVRSVKVQGGEFTYRRVYGKRSALIRVTEIEGGIGALSGTSHAPTEGRVTAVLEGSGKVDLRVNAAYFAPAPDVEVELEIRGQNLARLNPYFFPGDGVRLSGQLNWGRGRVTLKNEKLEAEVMARYSGFDLLLKAHGERSATEAFFGNFLRSLQIDDTNLSEPGRDQRRQVRLQRRGNESVVSALVRGLREAILKIATT